MLNFTANIRIAARKCLLPILLQRVRATMEMIGSTQAYFILLFFSLSKYFMQ